MKEEQEMCQIGRVLRPHGIRGEVKVQVFSDEPDRFRMLDHVYVLNGEDNPRKLEVLSTRNQGAHALITFAGVTDREAAEALAGRTLFIEDDQMLPPPEGKRYIHELIGMEVRTDGGRFSGILADVLDLPAHKVYVVEVEGREVLVPAVPEFILSVDMEQRRITVREMPGLFDEEE